MNTVCIFFEIAISVFAFKTLSWLHKSTSKAYASVDWRKLSLWMTTKFSLIQNFINGCNSFEQIPCIHENKLIFYILLTLCMWFHFHFHTRIIWNVALTIRVASAHINNYAWYLESFFFCKNVKVEKVLQSWVQLNIFYYFLQSSQVANCMFSKINMLPLNAELPQVKVGFMKTISVPRTFFGLIQFDQRQKSLLAN